MIRISAQSHETNNRGACELTRAGGSLCTVKLKSACREPDLSLSVLDPVPLSKIGTRLLASLGSKGLPQKCWFLFRGKLL